MRDYIFDEFGSHEFSSHEFGCDDDVELTDCFQWLNAYGSNDALFNGSNDALLPHPPPLVQTPLSAQTPSVTQVATTEVEVPAGNEPSASELTRYCASSEGA